MKSGTVAVIGRANAGKSTLINVLVGEKIAIVSPKPQTTRDRILGILTTDDYQIVFEDTPGIYKSGNLLSGYMQKNTDMTAKDVDLIMFVIDGHKGVNEEDLELLEKYIKFGTKLIVAFTKIDIMEKERVPVEMFKFSTLSKMPDIVPVSARKGKNTRKLLEVILENLDEGDYLYSKDIISDKSEKFMVSEIMREKLLLLYDKEIPHGTAIIINEFKLRDSNEIYDVNLDIICEKPNHKAIIIGKRGEALKQTVTYARQDMEKFLGKKVFLTAYVKVKEDWRDRANLVKEYGYEEYKD